MTDEKTLFAIRIRANSIWHQIFALGRILFVLVVILAAIAALQVHLCHETFPKRSAIECIRGVTG